MPGLAVANGVRSTSVHLEAFDPMNPEILSKQKIPVFRPVVLMWTALGLLVSPLEASTSGTPDLPEITGQSTLEDLIQYASLNHPGLRAQFEAWKADLQKIPQVRALPDPRLNYGYFIRSIETRVGPQHHRIGLAQTFPWFGKLRLREERAMSEAEITFQQLDAERLRLWYEILDAYHELGYLHRALDTVRENLGLLRQLEGVAQARLQGGGSYLGVVKAQVELGKLEDRQRSLKEMLRPVQARLNAALGREPEALLPMPSRADSPGLSLPEAELFAQLESGSPLLKAMEARIEREQKGLQLARRNYYPDVTLGVDYITTGDAFNPATAGSGKDAVMATFSINLPLWRSKLNAEVREAEARREAAIAGRDNLSLRLKAQLQKAVYEYQDAERKILLYQDALVPQVRSALSVAQKAFEGGTADFLEVVDAQRQLLEFQLQVERSIANREQRLAEIGMILGGGSLVRHLPNLPPSP